MGLLPLEFTECLTDSPYFRENLHAHEKELEKTSLAIKVLIKEVKDLVNAARGKTIPPVLSSLISLFDSTQHRLINFDLLTIHWSWISYQMQSFAVC